MTGDGRLGCELPEPQLSLAGDGGAQSARLAEYPRPVIASAAHADELHGPQHGAVREPARERDLPFAGAVVQQRGGMDR